MLLELGLMAGFLLTFGVLVACVGTAIVNGQSSNRAEVERVREEFERIVGQLGEEEGEST